MLFLLHRANHQELTYRGGQGPIVHLVFDLRELTAWAEKAGRRWAFSLSNAGAYYFEDRCDLSQLDEINWDAVQTRKWAGSGVPSVVKEGKQAEFLIEHSVPWSLVENIGVIDRSIAQRASDALRVSGHRPEIHIKRDWYY